MSILGKLVECGLRIADCGMKKEREEGEFALYGQCVKVKEALRAEGIDVARMRPEPESGGVWVGCYWFTMGPRGLYVMGPDPEAVAELDVVDLGYWNAECGLRNADFRAAAGM